MYEDNHLYQSFKIMDRFKWSINEVRGLSAGEFEAALAYIQRHPIDPFLHTVLVKNTVYSLATAGAKVKCEDAYPELDYHYTVPEYLLSDEEFKERRAKEIQRMKEAFYKKNPNIET